MATGEYGGGGRHGHWSIGGFKGLGSGLVRGMRWGGGGTGKGAGVDGGGRLVRGLG